MARCDTHPADSLGADHMDRVVGGQDRKVRLSCKARQKQFLLI
jgi:hypothetical protein